MGMHSFFLSLSLSLLLESTGGRELPSTERHRVYENGTLIISEANRELDEGVYVCKAINEKGETHSRNLYLQVLSKFFTSLSFPSFSRSKKKSIKKRWTWKTILRCLWHMFLLFFILFPPASFPVYLSLLPWTEKPNISPFRFPATLTEGMSVITTCSILTGDPPIHVDWFKDNEPLDFSSLNVHRNEMGDLGSSLVFRSVGPAQAGNYTCLAKNRVGEDRFTAPMIVRSKLRSLFPSQCHFMLWISKQKTFLRFSIIFSLPTSSCVPRFLISVSLSLCFSISS